MATTEIVASRDVRPDIVTWANWGIAHKSEFDYDEIRPMPLTTHAPIRDDCSGFCTLVYFLADAPDPNGPHYNYDGYGNTDTLYANAKHIPVEQVLPGDLAIFGLNPTLHGAVIIEGGEDPITSSHGSPNTPQRISVSALQEAVGEAFGLHGLAPVTYCRYNTNDRHAPTPKPTKNPTAEDLKKAGLVLLTSPAEARRAISHGWTIYIWGGTQFEHASKSEPKGTPEYASVDWNMMRSTTKE